ncbi:hypothetical protein MAM1_0390d10264 [Mucor ambiguus]|uniref:Mid2 domain-containing protein n=1 Tax=Mucor ambiguus TaxID=91626 RepID=A0A0C9N7U9_9FUNG|nr:hypothetical protein MAM1_0390d10264 [Mucor ambiguus]
MSSSTYITSTTTQSDTSDMSPSPDATDQAKYSNTPQKQTVTEVPVPESTTAAEATSESALTTTTDVVATATAATEDQVEPTTQAHKTTEAPMTVEATQTTQDVQAYTESPYHNYNQPDSQPTTDIQQSMASNPTVTLTETSIASVSPTVAVVTSISGVSTVLSTSTCTPSSTATASNMCNGSSSAAANADKMTVAQIAGIVVGVLGLFSLLVACFLFKKRKHSKTNNKRRISPFFYLNDQHPDPEKSLQFDTSTAALCQSYKNERSQAPNTTTNSSASDMSESVCGDNIFYSNSTDYRRSSTIMHQQGSINEKLTVITSPGKLHHTAGYASSPLKMDASAVDTPTTLYPHMKRSDSSDFNKQTSSYNPFSNQRQNDKRTSTDIDTDNYTLSAMQLFQSSANRNTATTTTTSRSISPMSSFVGAARQQYRPSLHDSMFLSSQRSSSCKNSSNDDSSTIRSLPIAQQPPPRFSRHHRQESSLDPHFYQQQQQQPHTMSLWDDHLN